MVVLVKDRSGAILEVRGREDRDRIGWEFLCELLSSLIVFDGLDPGSYYCASFSVGCQEDWSTAHTFTRLKQMRMSLGHGLAKGERGSRDQASTLSETCCNDAALPCQPQDHVQSRRREPVAVQRMQQIPRRKTALDVDKAKALLSISMHGWKLWLSLSTAEGGPACCFGLLAKACPIPSITLSFEHYTLLLAGDHRCQIRVPVRNNSLHTLVGAREPLVWPPPHPPSSPPPSLKPTSIPSLPTSTSQNEFSPLSALVYPHLQVLQHFAAQEDYGDVMMRCNWQRRRPSLKTRAWCGSSTITGGTCR